MVLIQHVDLDEKCKDNREELYPEIYSVFYLFLYQVVLALILICDDLQTICLGCISHFFWTALKNQLLVPLLIPMLWTSFQSILEVGITSLRGCFKGLKLY